MRTFQMRKFNVNVYDVSSIFTSRKNERSDVLSSNEIHKLLLLFALCNVTQTAASPRKPTAVPTVSEIKRA